MYLINEDNVNKKKINKFSRIYLGLFYFDLIKKEFMGLHMQIVTFQVLQKIISSQINNVCLSTITVQKLHTIANFEDVSLGVVAHNFGHVMNSYCTKSYTNTSENMDSTTIFQSFGNICTEFDYFTPK